MEIKAGELFGTKGIRGEWGNESRIGCRREGTCVRGMESQAKVKWQRECTETESIRLTYRSSYEADRRTDRLQS